MDYQFKTPDHVFKLFEQHGIQQADPDFYAWPQSFASTSGPRGGIGGCAISSFTVEAYHCYSSCATVYICNGMYHFSKEKFEPLKHIKSWLKIPKEFFN